jgi:phosphoribosylformylglycinamidine synthase
MLWEVEIRPAASLPDREGERVLERFRALRIASVMAVRSGRSFLLEGDFSGEAVASMARDFLVDAVVETFEVRLVQAPATGKSNAPQLAGNGWHQLNVLFRPGVTDNVAETVRAALCARSEKLTAVRTCQKYWFQTSDDAADLKRVALKLLANDAIQHVIWGELRLSGLGVGSRYQFHRATVPLREMTDAELVRASREGQLSLSLPEMRAIRQYFVDRGRDPTDAELETVAQTWSEHCSHKTLRGKVRYTEPGRILEFNNLLKETIFLATSRVRERLGAGDWCVSVFEDNAGVVKFDERQHACMKVETHNHPSAIEPYGGANTGLGGVIRDLLGTGLGARPICNTDVFCFADPKTPFDDLPAGVLHPRVVMQGVVAGVRDYGNRMGIPTVNGAIFFDERYLANPLVFCGTVAMLPVGAERKGARPGDLIVTAGGRTGRDGIHGATFSSAELTHESEAVSGGAVQIGNAIAEKMLCDVILQARDRGLYTAITDCGAGGFSSAVGEMAAQAGAIVWLDRAPLKYAGLSYSEIWISEAQERMVLAVPPEHWPAFRELCASEGVEATAIGEFTSTRRLILEYQGQQVADLEMQFLHEGRPPVVREAHYVPPSVAPLALPRCDQFNDELLAILGALNVCGKEWVIRQYDHEVQSGSVVKPLVGVRCDGPSDAAVVRPDLDGVRGLVIANGMNPRFGEIDPYWMAASAIDEALRNCIAVGADPARIALLDNFCWGNTDRPETLGTLVRAALGCKDAAVAFGTPFISGKDSLNNEFAYTDSQGGRQTVVIPPTLLISALGQIADVRRAVTMDLKRPGNLLFLVGATENELGGSHFALIKQLTGGEVPKVNFSRAPRLLAQLHAAIERQLVRSCHDISEGGLAAAVAEMAFAGDCGAELDLRVMGARANLEEDAVLLFSESNTRFVVEVAQQYADGFRALFAGLPLAELGQVASNDRLLIRGMSRDTLIDLPIDALRQAWKSPLAW